MIPGHVVVATLKEARGERVVLRTRFQGCDSVTRILGQPVDLALGPLVTSIAVRGRGSAAGLPEAIALTLEAYRLRSSLGDMPGLPRVLGAGVIPGIAMSALPRATDGQGHVWVTTEWAEGKPLADCFPHLPDEGRDAILIQILDILQRMHARRALFGDLKPANVVVGAAGVSFIDIDTIREVPAPDQPVPTRDLTPRYAAPEQTAQRHTFLASDLYAFGVMTAQLMTGKGPEDTGFPGSPRSPWCDVVDACLRPSPQTRATAEALLAFLLGGHPLPGRARDDGTERVADPLDAAPGPLAPARTVVEDPSERSISVRLPSSPVPPSPAHAPPAPPFEDAAAGPSAVTKKGPRALLLVGCLVAALLAVVAIVAVVLLANEAGKRQEALAIARAQMAALRRHKTVAAENGPAVIDAIVVEARRGLDLARTPEGQGVYALALVWSQRWHWSGAKWDAQKYQYALSEISDPLTRLTTEGGLAGALLSSAACRLMPDVDPLRPARCAESKEAFATVIGELSARPDMGWLEVEAVWGELMLVAHESWRLRKNKLPGEAEAKAREALIHCESVRDQLVDAPVNGREVAEDCLSVSGAARDYPAFLSWGAWVVQSDLEARQAVDSKKTLPKLYRFGAPECGDLRIDVGRDLRPKAKVRGNGGWGDFCEYAGLVALGCKNEAELRRPATFSFLLGYSFVEAEGVPWDALEAAAAVPPRQECALPMGR